MEAYVYKITNLVNGKIYLGVHISNEFDPTYYGSGKLIKRAIEKYGKENFTIEVLEEFDDIDLAFDYEHYVIDELDAVNDDMYYNLAPGGHGGFYKGNRHIWELYPWALEEAGKNISRSLKGRRWMNRDGVGKKVRPEEVEQHLSEGWVIGTPPNWSHNSPGARNTIWVNNGIEQHRVRPDELEDYLNNDYHFGCLNSHLSGRKRMTDGTNNIMVEPLDIPKKLVEGYHFGITRKPTSSIRGRLWVNKDGINRRATSDELGDLLENGWVKGLLKRK